MARISKGAIKRAAKQRVEYAPAESKTTKRALKRIEDGRCPGSVGDGIREIAVRRAARTLAGGESV